MLRLLGCVSALAVAAGVFGVPTYAAAPEPTPIWRGVTERVSETSDGEQVTGASHEVALSRDADVVAFSSSAPDLVRGDTNDASDIFVRNLATGRVQRVSVRSDGTEGGNDSLQPALSGTGRFVAFTSKAGNLVRGDTNRSWDVFVHDRRTDRTRRVSVTSSGKQVWGPSTSPSISADGRIVAFVSESYTLVREDENEQPDVFAHDRRTGITQRVSVSSKEEEGGSYSYHPSVSANGRFVAFYSLSSTLSPRNGWGDDVYVRNLDRGTTRLVSLGNHEQLGNSGSYLPSISGDGRFVAFTSNASNLVAGDTNRKTDVFVRDRKRKTTIRVSIGNGGVQGTQDSGLSAISADGRLIAFHSWAPNWLDEEHTKAWEATADVFIHNRRLGTTHFVSVARHGQVPLKQSRNPAISLHGPTIAFESEADNLVVGDTNGAPDVFVRTRR